MTLSGPADSPRDSARMPATGEARSIQPFIPAKAGGAFQQTDVWSSSAFALKGLKSNAPDDLPRQRLRPWGTGRAVVQSKLSVRSLAVQAQWTGVVRMLHVGTCGGFHVFGVLHSILQFTLGHRLDRTALGADVP